MSKEVQDLKPKIEKELDYRLVQRKLSIPQYLHNTETAISHVVTRMSKLGWHFDLYWQESGQCFLVTFRKYSIGANGSYIPQNATATCIAEDREDIPVAMGEAALEALDVIDEWRSNNV